MKKFNKTLVQLLCPFGNWKHTKGMQIVDKVSGEKLVKNFGGIFRAKIPVYIGHPDENPKTAQAAKAVGQIDKLFLCENSIAAIVRYEESVYKKIVLGEIRAMSPRWQMERVNAENFRPVKLVSVGLTNNPNIPESGKVLCPELSGKNPTVFSLVEKCKSSAEISLNAAKKCSAKSRKFSRLATSRSDEPVPEGLAHSLYMGLGTLQYDSQFCIYNAQAHNYAGKALNLKGANPLFENMNSAVVECRQDLFESTLTIKAGIPEHLYPAKIAELFRINKARKTTASFSTKTKAQSPLKGKISLNAQSVKEVPTQINTVMRAITLSVDATKPKIVLDSSNIPDGITLGVQRVLVCENGHPAYAYTILSNTE